MTTEAYVSGVREYKGTGTQWLVSARGPKAIIHRTAEDVSRVANVFKVNSRFQAEIEKASMRNSALPTTFKTMELCGVVERLAMAVAKYATWGDLTCNDIKGGGAWNVRSINAATDNIAVGPGNVFMTKKAADNRHPAVDCCIAAAVSGCGATMYTDLLALDGNNVPQIMTYEDATLASGCVEALRILGALFRDNEAGPDYALAIVRGVHKVVSVAGHSDEGSYVRTVLRRTSYAVPSGAILVGCADIPYTGLPVPGGSLSSFRMLVHSIALASAGLSACADPMVTYDGKQFPTIICSDGAYSDAGVASVVAEGDVGALRTDMQGKWAAASAEWAKNYAYLLAHLFHAPGSTVNAVATLGFCAGHCIGVIDDHLETPVAVAFYWVEPTGVVPFSDNTLPAFGNCCGPLAFHDQIIPRPAFSGVSNAENLGPVSTFTLDFRFARRHPMLLHLEQHAANGLSNIRLMSGSPESFANVGGTGALAGRILGAQPLSTFLWGRLHNQIVAVGELVNTNRLLRLSIEHYSLEVDTAWTIERRHTPNLEDLTRPVKFSCVKPGCGGLPSRLVDDCRPWARSRSRAAQALENMRSRTSDISSYWGANVVPVLGEPLGTTPAGVLAVDALEYAMRGSAVDHVATGPAHNVSTLVSSRPVSDSILRTAGALAPVIHNVADRGPRAHRQGRVVVQPAGGAVVGAPAVPNARALQRATAVAAARQALAEQEARAAELDPGDAAARVAADTAILAAQADVARLEAIAEEDGIAPDGVPAPDAV
jgi:hypothetical protein